MSTNAAKILAASFKNVTQVAKALAAGAKAVTAGADIFAAGLPIHPFKKLLMILQQIGKATQDVLIFKK